MTTYTGTLLNDRFTISGGTHVYVGSSGYDQITINPEIQLYLDYFNFTTSLDVRVNGTTGTATIDKGNRGVDTISIAGKLSSDDSWFSIYGSSADDRFFIDDNSGVTYVINGVGGEDRIEATGGVVYANYRTANNSIVYESNDGNRASGSVRLSGYGGETDTLINAAGVGGTRYADTFNGGRGNEIFFAHDGNDDLNGGAGNDELYGEGGNDNLDGGTGADLMSGGTGNDTYQVDHASARVIELDGGGIDHVFSTVSFSLRTSGANVERLTLQGAGGLTGEGNNGDNTIVGDVGNDRIDGGGGVDTMVGGAGNDTYFVDNREDRIIEAQDEGTDLVVATVSYSLNQPAASVENLILRGTDDLTGEGTSGNNTITGHHGNDKLIGHSGNDTLRGGNGHDRLFGNNGQDRLEGGNGNDILQGHNGHDILIGGKGADEMEGGSGNDIYYIDNVGDRVIEAAGQGVDHVYSNRSYALSGSAANVENLTLTGSANMTGTGNAGNNRIVGDRGNDTLTGLAGHDTLNGGAGADTMVGGVGNDAYHVDNVGDRVTENARQGTDVVVSTISYDLSAVSLHIENLILRGTADLTGTGNDRWNVLTGHHGDDTLHGLAGNDTLRGGNGNDTLDGGRGADLMEGGRGNDTYYVDHAGDRINESAGEGTDSVITNRSFDLSAYSDHLENLTLRGSAGMTGTGTSANNVITGDRGDDTLIGLAGNDVLDGGAGADVMNGGTGDDTFYFDNVGDQIIEASGEGADRVISNFSFDLSTYGAELEHLTLRGTADMTGTGNASDNEIIGDRGDDTLTGLGGNDVLNGGAGADTMTGGTGNDTYYVDNAGDRIIENAGEGTDHVISTFSTDLSTHSAELEHLTLVGNTDLTGVGNSGANRITSDAGNDTLRGLGGNDVLNGGAGADLMVGGTGNDVYHVDNRGDRVVENGGEGTDLVVSSVSFSIRSSGQDIENLILRGTARMTGEGNSEDNVITGHHGDDKLIGHSGDDTLRGGNGNDQLFGNNGQDRLEGGNGIDTLYGHNGHDILDGGIGFDTMVGGLGNDIYYVDAYGDTVTEFDGEGTDLVVSTSSFSLATGGGLYVENLILRGSGFKTGVGNSLGNTITGHTGNDSLYGRSGDDILRGGHGFDHLWGGNGQDVLEGGAQNDHLSGENGHDTLRGGDGWDTFWGGEGNDILDGGSGRDRLNGGNGNDTFVFNDAGHRDIIEYFQDGLDTIQIGLGVSSFSEITVTADGFDTLLSFAGAWVEIQNVNHNLIDAGDFTFV